MCTYVYVYVCVRMRVYATSPPITGFNNNSVVFKIFEAE